MGTGIRFRIIEPMMFRKSGEFDLSSRGFHSSARSMLMPTPSTILGAISTVLMKENEAPSANASWVDEYLDILGADNVLRGPYLIVGRESFVEDRIDNILLELKEVKELCDVCKGGFNKEWKEELTGKRLRIGSFNERVGIGLMTRVSDDNKSTKITKEGLLYSAFFVDYSSKDMSVTSVYLHMDTKVSLCDKLRDFRIMRLGGEGRIALLEPSTETMIERLRKEFWGNMNNFTGKLALFLVSPALFRSGREISELKKEIECQVAGSCKGLREMRIYGKITLLGAGYSLSKRGRKPIYIAAEPGTLILTDVTDCNLETLYWNGIGEVGREIGYGSLLPIPINNEKRALEATEGFAD
ncbi:MAG: type III-B CRISPR module-associated Cmr3 family protein [Candidatus Bathyarchaeia archaeon]|uniref:type III-B CRISPR module-associated Cmr3 family protein n=1 Tax=Thermofilum sp. TaxID=1961369 RepID=UPI003165A61B